MARLSGAFSFDARLLEEGNLTGGGGYVRQLALSGSRWW